MVLHRFTRPPDLHYHYPKAKHQPQPLKCSHGPKILILSASLAAPVNTTKAYRTTSQVALCGHLLLDKQPCSIFSDQRCPSYTSSGMNHHSGIQAFNSKTTPSQTVHRLSTQGNTRDSAQMKENIQPNAVPTGQQPHHPDRSEHFRPCQAGRQRKRVQRADSQTE